MEAKDTVMKYQRKHPVVAGSNEWHMIDGYNMGAEAQAEISFKAGYEQGELDSYATDFGEGKRTGIKKVVEWLNSKMELERCDPDVMPYFTPYYAILEEDWQAQLKEWGI